MQYFLQILAYISQFIFLCLLLVMIISSFIRLMKFRTNYNPIEDELLIEFRCLTATKQYIFGKTNVNLGQGTYVIGTSIFSELRIAKTKTHFSGILEVLDTGECHLYINSGEIVINEEEYDQNENGYICMYPGDIFTIGRQTCMINSLFEDDEDSQDGDDFDNNASIDESDEYYYQDEDYDYNGENDILNYNGYDD